MQCTNLQNSTLKPSGRPVTQLSIHINISALVRHVNYLYQVNRHPAVKRKWLQLQSMGEEAKWIESRRYIITVIVCESLLLCICFSLSACVWSVSLLMLARVYRWMNHYAICKTQTSKTHMYIIKDSLNIAEVEFQQTNWRI